MRQSPYKTMVLFLRSSLISPFGPRPIIMAKSQNRLSGKRIEICGTWLACSRKSQESMPGNGSLECWIKWRGVGGKQVKGQFVDRGHSSMIQGLTLWQGCEGQF